MPGKCSKKISMKNDTEDNRARLLFQIIVENNKKGVKAREVLKEYSRKRNLKIRTLGTNILTTLESNGFFCYTDQGRLFAYKDMNTGKVYSKEEEE